MSFFDIFRGPMNVSLDLTRMVGASAAILYPLPYVYVGLTKGTIPDPSAFGVGYAAVLAAIGGMIGIKDVAVAKANATSAAAQP